MALINRFSRLFTADLNAVLDRIEEPDIVLKQAVRDMEEELVEMEARLRALSSEAERLTLQERGERERLTEIEEALDVCFQSGEDELARGLIRRRIETERRAKLVRGRHDAVLNAAGELEATLSEDRRHLESMRQKLDVLVVDRRGSGAVEFGGGDIVVGNEEVEVAFLQEKQRRVR